MTDSEAKLLSMALAYEEGHPRRTQHILKVYALAMLLGKCEGLREDEKHILHAAAILHDIAIKYCKQHYNGDACQENQKKEAPRLVESFLKESGYPAECIPAVTELVKKHHDYYEPHSVLLQLLIEADLIVNCYETNPERSALSKITALFKTQTGLKLFCTYENGAGPLKNAAPPMQ